MIKGINHVGVVVRDADEVVSFLRETFGAEELKRVEFPGLKQISSIVRLGDSCFELMEPTSPEGTTGRFLDTKGGGLHHISLLCDDVEAECKRLETMGLKVIGKRLESPVKVAFLHPKSGKGILFELAERSSLEGA